ncbi:hypothetical protein CHS0354_023543 [Potamilus streckersoni]|uniref:Uncharacterized protein n=1 Tax=Potamilus streckersoni TaxID=2493646 RepID=A0AAE0S8B0_9BIVA|nr:hypothetical protein CHS0354_023543 [Potamilus streckersoni]
MPSVFKSYQKSAFSLQNFKKHEKALEIVRRKAITNFVMDGFTNRGVFRASKEMLNGKDHYSVKENLAWI